MPNDPAKRAHGRAVDKPCPYCGALKCTACGGKYCTKCSDWKLYSEFNQATGAYDGYDTRCRACRRIVSQAYLAAGGRERKKEYRIAHREENKKYDQKWREMHKDEHYQRTRKYALEHYSAEDRKNFLLKTRYGISKVEYDRMFEDQQGACKICGKIAKLVVDHAHDTSGQVRGLLCRKCNAALGHFGENIATILAAIVYLRNDGDFDREAYQISYNIRE